MGDYYRQIQGWFDFEDLYDRAVREAPPQAVFVEIGAWLGRSTAYLAQRIKESGKDIRLYVVDTWKGSPGEQAHEDEVRRAGGSIYPAFLENMRRAQVDDVILPMPMRSDLAAQSFADESLDFVFLDSSNRYEDVVRDLSQWYPKVRLGGVLAGHDYQPGCPDVVRAVNEFFRSEKIFKIGNCFGVKREQRTQPRLCPMDNSKCVILLPVAHHIEPDCDRSLRELEARGYTVWRIGGYSQIDIARSQIATDALADGFEELMWIDADIAFDPSSVDRLRSHNLPVSCVIYPKKGQRALACHIMPGTKQITFGEGGGLVELLYGATGFLLTHADVYRRMQETEKLPVCNQQRGRPIVPYFLPMIVPDGEGHWYLGEDFAFFERLRRSGYQIFADTTIRLRHIGGYGYTWEDAGSDPNRYATYHFNTS